MLQLTVAVVSKTVGHLNININVFYNNMRYVSLLTNVTTKLEDMNKTHEM